MTYYVYMLRCGDGSLYTGWTNDLDRRIEKHNTGKGAKYTRGRLPVALVYSEGFSSKAAAMRREREIKALSRREKLELVKV